MIYNFEFPHGTSTEVPVKTVLSKGDNSIPISDRWEQYIDYYSGKIGAENLTFKLPKTRVKIERSDPDVNLDDCIYQMRSSGIRALSVNRPFPTFAVSVSGGGAMIPVCSKERRHLSVPEIKRIMGYPDFFEFPVSRTHAIKQLANSVCPPVISAVGQSIETHLLGESQCLFNRSEMFSPVG
jgi:DNA (cytosine-5)-methyltransferase 1